MRRALLLTVLVAPALAAAQSAGQVMNGTTKGPGEPIPDDKYINIDECNGSVTSDLELLWNVKLVSGKTVNGGNFRVYGSNKEPPTTEPRFCPDPDPANTLYRWQIGSDKPATANRTTDGESIATKLFVTPAGTEVSPFTCAEGQSEQTIWLCVHYLDTANSNAGWAVGSLILSLRRPPPPSNVSARPGEGALNVSWTRAPEATGSEAPATGYRVIVMPQGSTTVVASKDVTSTSYRVEGLQNGTTYTVNVYSLSVAMNQSKDPATGEGTPAPVLDFWEYYHDTLHGKEQGGCGIGGGGPLALIGIAALLARLRRRA